MQSLDVMKDEDYNTNELYSRVDINLVKLSQIHLLNSQKILQLFELSSLQISV